MLKFTFRSAPISRLLLVLLILLSFSPNCRQSRLVRSQNPSARNAYRPASPGSLSSYIRTVLKISSEKGPQAEQALKQAQERDPDLLRQAEASLANPADLQAGLRLAQSYLGAGLLHPAYEVYQRLRAAAEPQAEIELGLAVIWDKWRDYSLARTHAEYALELDAQSHQAWNLLGRIHLHRGDFQSAAASFERAVSLHESDATLFANAGYACLRLGRLESAKAYLEKALSLDGAIAEAHNHLGIVLARRGEYDSAIVHFSQTSDPATALNNLGTVCLEQGKLQEARKYFEQAVALKPDYEKALERLREVNDLTNPPARVSVSTSPTGTAVETRAELPIEEPSSPDAVTLPSRVSVSISPHPMPELSPARSDLRLDSAAGADLEKGIQLDQIVSGKDAYRFAAFGGEAPAPLAPGKAEAFLYLPVLPPSLKSVGQLALKELPAQALSRMPGPQGPGPSRSGANLEVTALRWQEPLLNPVALADVSLGWSSSPHSDQPGQLYFPSGVNLLLSGLFAVAVVIGLLLSGSLGAVVRVSLVLAGVVAGLMVM